MPYSITQSDLQAYLKDISRYGLLKADEEHALAVQIRRAWRAYQKALGPKGTKNLRPSRNALKALAEYTRVRDRMIEANLRLVVSISKRYTNRGLTLLDLVEEGNIGLLKAAERFDPRMGTRFSTYATYWIRQAVRRALVNTGQTVRVPVYMVEIIAKWKHAALDLAGRLGREPTFDEIARALDISPDKVGLIKRAVRGAAQNGTGGVTDMTRAISDMLADEKTAKPEEHLFEEHEREKLTKLLRILDAREAQILRMRFGLDDERPRTLDEIGRKLKITRERVRQIEARTLQKLHHTLTQGDEDRLSPQPGRGGD